MPSPHEFSTALLCLATIYLANQAFLSLFLGIILFAFVSSCPLKLSGETLVERVVTRDWCPLKFKIPALVANNPSGLVTDHRSWIQCEAEFYVSWDFKDIAVVHKSVSIEFLSGFSGKHREFFFQVQSLRFKFPHPTDHRIGFVWKDNTILLRSAWRLWQYEIVREGIRQYINYASQVEFRGRSFSVVDKREADAKRGGVFEAHKSDLTNSYVSSQFSDGGVRSTIYGILSGLGSDLSRTPLESRENGVGETAEEDHRRENGHNRIGVLGFAYKVPRLFDNRHWIWLLIGISGVVLALYGLAIGFVGYVSFGAPSASRMCLQGLVCFVVGSVIGHCGFFFWLSK